MLGSLFFGNYSGGHILPANWPSPPQFPFTGVGISADVPWHVPTQPL